MTWVLLQQFWFVSCCLTLLCSLLIRYNLLFCCLVLAALVTCVALDQCGWYLVSGSHDCTCVIWDISHLSSAPIKPVQTLYGHDQPITTVAIATELDMVASGSKVNTHFILCPFNALRVMNNLGAQPLDCSPFTAASPHYAKHYRVLATLGHCLPPLCTQT